ncbi:hypothetical protein DAI18_18110 [Microvirgula aerodenitrificans]|uniref:DUF2634 domain-containing protein n=1 Tax=Microvirgula aerodenitrificans TaxID=57480 RepID=A0A2S0PED5_9NEIS|nr:hypothetical protein [Microvirgula aerodenitrificans]AVY95744.1 hypothetical protein DAI18_18110 [Microvirgula aerodenitrificans]
MRVRRVDADNDWTFGQGRASYAGTSESVAQRVRTRLLSFMMDWFLDLDHGLPWLGDMERPADLTQVERDIKRQILKTEGVAEITSFEMEQDTATRKLRIVTTLRDVYGGESTVDVDR